MRTRSPAISTNRLGQSDAELQVILRGSSKNLCYFLNFAVLDARRTDPNMLARAVHHGMHLLKVDVPAALGYVVRVAHLIPELRAAPASITRLRHC